MTFDRDTLEYFKMQATLGEDIDYDTVCFLVDDLLELEQECKDRDETEQSLVAWNEKLHTQKEAWLAAAMALQELIPWEDPDDAEEHYDKAKKLLDIAASLER